MFKFDFEYSFSPDWQPENCKIERWFLTDAITETGADANDKICAYRTDKLIYVRERLKGIDHEQALEEILEHVLADSKSEEDRFRAIVFFIQRMMIHLMNEQPMEADAIRVYRKAGGAPAESQGAPYSEDLAKPWMRKAFEEARIFGDYLGLYCNPLGVTLEGDWGIGGVVSDALELLMLHEGRCGHQAMVAVQLAQIAGMRARLVQVNHHRVAEIMVDGRWRLADPDALAPGFIGTDGYGNPVSIRWCIDNCDQLRDWPVIPIMQQVEGFTGYDWFYHLS